MFEYICTICGAVFEEEGQQYGNYHGCPYCGNDVELLRHCEICDEPVPDSKFEYGICENCKRKTLYLQKSLFDDLQTKGQVRFLQDKMDGLDWTAWKTW